MSKLLFAPTVWVLGSKLESAVWYWPREKLANGKRVGDATVRAKIDEGGNGMPQYKDMLSEQEKADLIAYLKTL
jgi:mono/diheme cytochrome c family protein